MWHMYIIEYDSGGDKPHQKEKYSMLFAYYGHQLLSILHANYSLYNHRSLV